MTIDELLLKNRIFRLNLPKDMLTDAEKIIEYALCKSDMEMKIVATDYVFPVVIQKTDGKQVLIWDVTYWEIYRMFLMGLADLNQEEKGTNIFINGSRSQPDNALLLVPFAYFLSVVVKNNETAMNFAKYYDKRSKESTVFRLGMPLSKFEEYIELSKIYLSMHEQMHIEYNNNPDKKSMDLLRSKRLIEIAKIAVEYFDDNFCRTEYLKSKQELLAMIDSEYEDARLREDILCDTYALNHCIAAFREIWKYKYSQKEIVTRCFEVFRIIGYFNSTLLSLKMFWQDCSCDYNLLNEFRVRTAQRYYLSELIACIQLAKQNLYDYDIKSKWEFSGFEENYDLENLIYSYFFSDEAVSLWKSDKEETIQNKEKIKERFELLDWRIA